MATPSNQRIKSLEQENAELRRQLAETLAQQQATAEVLGVINASPGDLTPVFDAILEKAARLCEADCGQLALFDGAFFRFVAAHGDANVVRQLLAAGPISPSQGFTWPSQVQGTNIVHIADIRDAEAYRVGNAAAREFWDSAGARTLLSVALRRDEFLLGTITVYRRAIRPFADNETVLLQNFAAQAVIAMENARLITETREALDQQTATAEVLQVINASPGDLSPVFDAMLEKALQLCGAAFGLLQVRDGDHFRTAATHGVPAAFAEFRRQNAPMQGPGTLGGRIMAGERFVHVLDLKDDEPYRSSDTNRRALVDLGGGRTGLAVPLIKAAEPVGFIIIYRREVRPFTDKQIALLQNFAAQAVIAMENARLLGELRQRTDDLQEALKYQTATNDVLKVLSNAAFDLKSVLERLIGTAVELCDGRMAFIYRRHGEVFNLEVSSGFTAEYHAYMASVPVSPGPGSLVGRVTASGRPVHIIDAANDPNYTWSEAQRGGLYRTMLGVPMICEGEVLGVIAVTREVVKPFGETQIELMTAFADQAVIAMENARLLGELRQRTDEVAELNRGLEARVAEQVDELGRVGNLKRFLPPQVAEVLVSQGNERILESHRREIVVVFCDVRGYTAFSETAEPEEVIEFLGEYHAALGPLITRFEGTLSHFLGDGLMVFFNDPVPCPDPADRAVKMAVAMREAAGGLVAAWGRRGHQLGFGAGVAQGYATLGQIGFADRSDYTAIGTVCNLAARLCGEATDGQILLARRVAVAVEDGFELEDLGALTLKGLTQPVAAFNVIGSAVDLAAAASD